VMENPFAAADVGTVYDRGRPYHHPRSLDRIAALVGNDPVASALDVACGTGMSTIALAERAQHVVGIDVSTAMLRVARAAPNISYAFASAERIPFSDGAFDATTCCSGVHWFDQARFYAEMHRVLRPGGWVGLYDHYYVGEMVDVPEFKRWTGEVLTRFPLPPRNPQVGDPRSETPAGFTKLGDEFFADDIAMTPDALADYQLTISNFVAAAERGTPRAEMRAWVLESTAPFFEGANARTVRFLGSINCWRRDSS
jgi:ubiquinone/menaquinone biosynthesis C-methylase UbiE